MKNKKMVFVASMILTLGIVMLLGTSYSLINNEIISKEGYSFNVADFSVEFLDNQSITMNGIPIEDNEGLEKGNEFTFTIANNSAYDVNYRLDILENSATKMDKVIKYSFSLNGVDDKNVYLLSDNYTINQNRVLAKGSIDVYKVKMWLSIDADETYMNKKFSGSISLLATHNENKYAADVITYLANNNLDGVKKENDVYRYVGHDAKNYVWFNCDDNYSKGEDYCEKWQIIGSFDNEWEYALKKYKSLKIVGNVGESILFNNDELNGKYHKSYIRTYANGYYYDKMSLKTQELILKGKWDIGDTNLNNYYLGYDYEKKESFYENIGLLNVSDYLYIRDDPWLSVDKEFFTLNKIGEEINVIESGEIKKVDTKHESGFLPVVYLKPDVSIISGDGSFDNPYELVIKYPMSYGIMR